MPSSRGCSWSRDGSPGSHQNLPCLDSASGCLKYCLSGPMGVGCICSAQELWPAATERRTWRRCRVCGQWHSPPQMHAGRCRKKNLEKKRVARATIRAKISTDAWQVTIWRALALSKRQLLWVAASCWWFSNSCLFSLSCQPLVPLSLHTLFQNSILENFPVPKGAHGLWTYVGRTMP